MGFPPFSCFHQPNASIGITRQRAKNDFIAMADLQSRESEEFLSYKHSFTEFLDSDAGEGEYMAKINEMMDKKSSRLIVNLNDLRVFNSDLTRNLIRRPLDYLGAFESALKDTALNARPSYQKEIANQTASPFHIGFEGSFGRHYVSPRGLLSNFLCSLVCIEGIVTKCSLVRPKVVQSAHFCPATNQMHYRDYRDATDIDGMPTGSVYPTKDQDGNPLETEFGLSVYKDHQTITIQEMPERAPLGQLPRSIDLILDHDLVDKAKPGDRIQVVGCYRALAGAKNGVTSGVFRTVVIANNVRVLGKEVHGLVMTASDISNIRAVSKRPDLLEVLTRSVAPSIFGHEHIKQALMLQMLGGIEKNLENGTHLRGDINMMLVGDPSCGKSQLLRFVLSIAPLAINTTGRGSSGVGLTAAVTQDAETGERRLEAGAMVLADRGVVCIDEFDKMSEADRVAIHEVMEQQTVTIAKAGIHASLNARCSVLAAANPVYGQYDKDKKPQANIGLPDSLLSRFDLLFIVLDTLEPEHDRNISDHVLRMHRYQRSGQEGIPVEAGTGAAGGGADEDEDRDEEEQEETAVWVKHNPVLHGARKAKVGGKGKKGKRGGRKGRKSGGGVEEDDSEQLLTTLFLKKYIHYAKNRIQPKLTEVARELIASEYAQLRSKQDSKTLPVTARTLETIIRISTAHAKTRLSGNVDESDVEAAVSLMKFALYNETKLPGELELEEEHEHQDEDEEEDGGAEESKKGEEDEEDESGGRRRGQKRGRKSGAKSPMKRGKTGDGASPAATGKKKESADAALQVEANDVDASGPRFKRFLEVVARAFNSTGEDEMEEKALVLATLEELAEDEEGEAYTQHEAQVLLRALQNDNKVMLDGGKVMMI